MPLTQDLKYAIRTLTRTPAFTVSVVLVLALGIGATTAIFSLVDATLLRPLPYADADELMMIWEETSAMGFPRNTPAPANYLDWKADSRAFVDMAATNMEPRNLTGDGEPLALVGVRATANLTAVLGIEPMLGRFFTSDEDQPDGPAVAVISHGLWQRRFGGDAGIVGNDIRLDGSPHTVVGVMGPRMSYPGSGVDVWVPMAFTAQQAARRESHYLNVVGRLHPGTSFDAAQADLARIAARLEQDYPRSNTNVGAYGIGLRTQFVGDVRSGFLLLLAAVGAVLLIACANIANLLLVRSSGRSREVAIRAALGAGRRRLIGQMLTESLVLSMAGGIVGLFFAWGSLTFLSSLLPGMIARSVPIALDLRVLAVGLGVSLATGLVFGLVPALSASGVSLNDTLRVSGRTGAGSASRRFRDVLVVGEVALTVALLVGAGLLLRSFTEVRSVDPGYRPENVLTVRTDLPSGKYEETARRHAFYREVVERVEALPSVESAGYTSYVPLTNRGGSLGFTIDGRPAPANGEQADANFRAVTRDYIQTIGMTLVAGRGFDSGDHADAVEVAIVNETMARQYWPGEDALGKRYKLGGFNSDSPWKTIVGVVADVRQMGLEVPARPEMYIPMEQWPSMRYFNPRDLAVRTSGDPLAMAGAVQAEIWEVDPDQPVAAVQTMGAILDAEVFQRRTQALLIGAFAVLALVVASVGIYGVLSYAVSYLTREIGLRMALGAERGSVLGMILRQGMLLAGVGCVVGIGLAYALGGVMSSMLFGVEATDPMTFVGVPVVLVAVALVASWIPARRATRVDPIVALRWE